MPQSGPGGRRQSLPSSSSRPQEPRALDLLSHSQPDAFPAREVPEVDVQTNENIQNDAQPQQPLVPDSQPQEDGVGNAGDV